jgi:hypothetical protein
VLRIRIRIRMNPHDFGLLDPHPESAFQMRIPDADADPGKIAPMIKLQFLSISLVYFKGKVQREFSSVF